MFQENQYTNDCDAEDLKRMVLKFLALADIIRALPCASCTVPERHKCRSRHASNLMRWSSRQLPRWVSYRAI
jgi:hypothetical protein